MTADPTDLSRSHQDAAAAVAHAIDELEGLLARPRFEPRKAANDLMLRRDMPYVIQETSIDGTQILVNRRYKPVGNPTTEFVKYEEYPNLFVRLSPEQIASIVSPGAERGLFKDGNPPWRDREAAGQYLDRLRRLAALL